MKKKLFLFFMLFSSLCISGYLFAQKTVQSRLDSLLVELPKAKEDTGKVKLLAEIISGYTSINPQEGLKYEKPALELAEKINWKAGIASVKRKSGRLYYRLGNFEEALKRHVEALSISEQLKDSSNVAGTLTFIGQDYADKGNYTQAISFFSKSLKISEISGDLRGQAYVHSLLSWVYTNMGNFPEATKSNLASLKIYEQLDDSHGIAIATSNIAGYYREMGNYPEARKYYQKSTGALKAIGDKLNLASLYIDFGRMNEATGKPTEALQYFNLSLQLGSQINDHFTIAFAQHNIGDWHKSQGNCAEALKYYLTAGERYRAISSKQQLADLLCSMGACYTRLNKFKEANECFSEALKLSTELNSPTVFSGYYGSREILDSALGVWKDAYFNYKLHIQKRDSINSDENNKKSLQLNMKYEFDKKEVAAKAEQDKKDAFTTADLKRQKMLRNGFVGGFAAMLLFAVVFFSQRNRIKREKQRSDELLLNILPSEVAEELKSKGSAEAKQFDEVTVMFTDFKGFTQISEKLSPTGLVNEIHTCFKAFDGIISKHNIEKIKTIGDSYMCAGGLPVANTTNATDVVSAAIEIQAFMQQHSVQRKNEGKEVFEIRIGIHSGPVVAGIVGVKKFAYDIWGDTVNIASRMESSGEAGKVNITDSTFELVKEKFNCIHRGKIHAKNKGEIDMYFVENKS